MARIVYGVSGDGYGHAVRAHSVGEGLIGRGHDVVFVGSHRSLGYLNRHFPDRVHETLGLRMTYREGRVSVVQTVLQNAARLIGSLGTSSRSLVTMLREFQPEFVITDFEPFTAFWARQMGIPYISLDNQHLLTHCDLDHPIGYSRDVFNAYLTIRLYYGGAQRYLITSFIKAPVRYQPAILIDPVLRPKVYERTPQRGDFLLAYKGAGGENHVMQEVLEKYAGIPIRAYGFDLRGHYGNGKTEFKEFCPNEFLNDLANCAGVISSAGHSLVCEALFFEKPMLLVPIVHQYEQLLNAHHVVKLKAGMAVHHLTTSAIDEFLDRLDEFRLSMNGNPKAALNTVLDAVEQEIP